MAENCGDLMCAADLICVVGKKAIRPPSCSSSILSKQSTEPQSTTVKSSLEAKGVNSSLNSCLEAYNMKHGRVYIDTATGHSTSLKKYDCFPNRKRSHDSNLSNTSWKFLSKSKILKTSLQHKDSSLSPCMLSHLKLTFKDKLPEVFYEKSRSKVTLIEQNGFNSIKLAKSHLQNIQVISQLDNKFIVCKISCPASKDEAILLFDQHAVHERIRLENFITDSVFESEKSSHVKSIALNNPLLIHVSSKQLELMQNNKKVFVCAGLRYDVCTLGNAGNVYINEVPVVLINHPKLDTLIQELIEERSATLLAHGNVGISMPPVIFNHLCSKACHGAIKFGDCLTLEQCKDLMENLQKCRLPFQCAHGRPSVHPLVNLSKISTAMYLEACNLNKLKLKSVA